MNPLWSTIKPGQWVYTTDNLFRDNVYARYIGNRPQTSPTTVMFDVVSGTVSKTWHKESQYGDRARRSCILEYILMGGE